MFFLGGRGEAGGNLGWQNVVPLLEFPQDTESNCDAVRDAKGSFISCFGFVFLSEIFEKGHGQETIRETLN